MRTTSPDVDSREPEKNSAWDARKNNFDALRLLLAVLVLFSHSYPLGVGTEVDEPIHRFTLGQMTGGAIAVDLFFVMSGFMITASMLRSRSVWQFAKRRLTRIYPAFAVCAILSLCVFAPIGNATLLSSPIRRAGDFLLQTLRLREFTYSGAFPENVYPGHAINGSVWSIQYEVWCYVGVAVLGLSGLLLRKKGVAVLFVASWLVSVLFLLRGWIFGGKFLGVLFGSPQLWARLLPFYLAGVLFYLFRDRIPHSPWVAVVCVITLLVSAKVPLGIAVSFPIAGTYLAFYLAYAAWLPLQQAGRFGDFSYGLYLYAFPIQQTVVRFSGHAMGPLRLFCTALPLTLAAAVASWYGVERRFLRPGRRHETVAHAVYDAAHPDVARS